MTYLPKLILILFLIGICEVSYTSSLKNEELNFVSELLQKIEFLDENPDIWPNFKFGSTPSIIYFNNEHHYAFNFHPTNPNWKQLLNFTTPVYYLDKDEYGIQNIPFGFNTIDNQSAYLFHYMEQSSIIDNIRVLIHERFHFYQFQFFPSIFFNYGTYYGFNNIENVKLSLLEIQILKNYLLNHEISSLEDYVAINKFRNQLMDKESIQYESNKEVIEGLADYYSWNSLRFSEQERNDAIYNTYDGMCSTDNLIKCQIHNRYYFTGTVISIALDKLKPNEWKNNFLLNNLSPHEQLLEILPLTDDQLPKRVELIKLRYRYDEITQSIESELTAYQKELKLQQQKYEEIDGITLTITKLPCQLIGVISATRQFMFTSEESFSLDINGNASCEDNSIYINYEHLPFLFNSTEYASEFKISPDTKIKLNEIELTAQNVLDQQQVFTFDNLSLFNTSIKLDIKNHKGTLEIKNHKIIMSVFN